MDLKIGLTIIFDILTIIWLLIPIKKEKNNGED